MLTAQSGIFINDRIPQAELQEFSHVKEEKYKDGRHFIVLITKKSRLLNLHYLFLIYS